jgi:hypothetical protein
VRIVYIHVDDYLAWLTEFDRLDSQRSPAPICDPHRKRGEAGRSARLETHVAPSMARRFHRHSAALMADKQTITAELRK